MASAFSLADRRARTLNVLQRDSQALAAKYLEWLKAGVRLDKRCLDRCDAQMRSLALRRAAALAPPRVRLHRRRA